MNKYIVMAIIIAVSMIVGGLLYKQFVNQQALNAQKACMMRFGDDNIQYQNGVNGLYNTNEYYCVWVKDRSPESIFDTASHEQCHHWVFEEYDHFCNNE